MPYNLEQGAADVMAVSEAAARDPLDRPVAVDEAEAVGEVHILLRRHPLVQEAQGRVALGARQPVHDPPDLTGASCESATSASYPASR